MTAIKLTFTALIAIALSATSAPAHEKQTDKQALSDGAGSATAFKHPKGHPTRRAAPRKVMYAAPEQAASTQHGAACDVGDTPYFSC